MTPSLLGWLLIAAALCAVAGVGLLDRRLRRRLPAALELTPRRPNWLPIGHPFTDAIAEVGAALLRLFDRAVPPRWRGRRRDVAGDPVVERIWALLALAGALLLVGIIFVAYPAQ